MGRHQQYAEGQRPSDYKPFQTEAYRLRKAKFDNGLAVLCAEAREGVPVSQSEIARRCGVSQMLVYRVERTAKRKVVAKLKALGVTRKLFSTGGLTGLL